MNNNIHVTIPSWIDSLIFVELAGYHRISGAKREFDNNLHSTQNEIKNYLGTYFPRSLAESFIIFDSLLSAESYVKKLNANGSISICSVGTGTGGDLLGLILALVKHLSSSQTLNVIAADGNEDALCIMQDLLSEAQKKLRWNITCKTIVHTFTNSLFEPLQRHLMQQGIRFDFVMSSKMMNEIIRSGISKRPYYHFCESFCKLLKPTGVLLLLDVTTPLALHDAQKQWHPQLLNYQINEYIRCNPNYSTILPLICNKFEEKCERACFTQNTFFINHRQCSKEATKISYRLIGGDDLAQEITLLPAIWNCPITQDNKEHCSVFSGC